MENALLNLFNQNLANKATDLYDQRQRDLVNQAAMDVFSTGFNNRNTGIMSQASGMPLYDDMAPIIDTSYGVANEPDVEEEIEETSNEGLSGLLRTMLGFAIPGAGLFMGDKSALEGIKSLNQRLRQSDFAQADNLMDYLDMRKYGGLQGRRDAAARNMAQARGIQNKIDTGEYRRTSADDVIDRGRGDRPGGANYSAPSKPQRSFSSDYSEAQRARKF
jgi:hypothetical protein